MITRESYKIIEKKAFAAVRTFMKGRKNFNNHDCQDIVSEIMLAVVTKSHTLKDKSKFKSWLASITRNKIYDFLRVSMAQNKKFPKKYVADSDDLEESFVETLVGVSDNTEELVDLGLLLKRLKGRIKYKHIGFVQTFLMSVNGYTYKEIAKITKNKLNTVRSRVFRGKKILRSYIDALQKELY